MKTKTTITILCILLSAFTYANEVATQTIRGRVIDQVTEYPLIGALVSIIGNNELSAITDENGNFEIQNVPLGRQSIVISYMGYKTITIDNLLLVSGKESMIEVSMEEEAVKVENVVVTAKAPTEGAINDMASVSARAINVEQTERFAGSLGDPARMAANYAGVSSKDDSRNDIVIRGNSPSGVLWRLEGVEIPNPNHFGALGATGGPVSMLNNNLLSNSDFLTGAFPAEYGNALAGAFDLNMRSGNSHEHEFTGQVGFNGFEFGAEGPLAKKESLNPSYLINFRYSTLEVMDKIGFNLGTGTAIPQYKDLTYMINIPTEKAGRFKIFGLWGNSFIALGRDFEDTTANLYTSRGTATDFGSHLFVSAASHTYYFNPNFKITSTLSFQETGAHTIYDSIIDNKYVQPFVRQNQSEQKYSFSQKFKYKFNSQLNMGIGYTYDHFYIDFIDSIYLYQYGEFKNSIDVQEHLSLTQGYIQLQYKPTNNFTVYGGLHGQQFSLNKQTVIEPRASIEYKINDNQAVTFGYGIHNQTQPKATYFHADYDSITDTYTQTNTNVKFTTNTHYILGYNYKFAKHARLKAEVYYQDITNAPVSAEFEEYSMLNAGADFNIPNIQYLENIGTGYNKGIEITLERFLEDGFYFLGTVSLFDSKYTDYNGVERNTAFNGNFIYNVLTGYEYEISEHFMLTFDAKLTYAGGKRKVPLDLEESIEQNEAVYDWSKAYDEKYDDYFRTDLRIGVKHNGKNFNQEWGLDLQNITNYQSIFMEGFDGTTGEKYNVYQQSFMPMMLYRIQF